MQIIITDPGTENEIAARDQDFQDELRKELTVLSGTIELRSSDIGHGADWPAILATLGGVSLLFFQGKRIKENLDAWIDLAKRFKALLVTLRRRFGHYRIDEHGAALIATHVILSKGPVDSLEKLNSYTVFHGTFAQRNAADLDHHPEAMFFQIFKVNGDRVYHFGIKSTGEVAFCHDYSLTWHDFLHGDPQLPPVVLLKPPVEPDDPER